MTRIDKVLDLTIKQPPPTGSDKVYEDINVEQVQPLHLSFITSLLRLIKEPREKPSSMAQIPRRVESLYRAHGEDTNFLTKHPLPNSFIVNSTQHKSRYRSAATPTNKEGKIRHLLADTIIL